LTADLISLAAARRAVLDAVPGPLAAEEVHTAEALGRVLAGDVEAEHDLPPFDNSAMDGYAVAAGPPRELEVVGESRAGRPAERALAEGQAIRISTGAVVPEGADAVVPVELASLSDGRVTIPEAAPGANVRRAGEDVHAGDTVLTAGAELGPAELGVLSSLGHDRVSCSRRPRVALVVTGDEESPVVARVLRLEDRPVGGFGHAARGHRRRARANPDPGADVSGVAQLLIQPNRQSIRPAEPRHELCHP